MEVLLSFTLLTIAAVVLVILGIKYRIFLKGNRNPVLLTIFAALFILGFLYLFYRTPGTAIGVAQPIPFSHRVHSGVKNIQCQYCHPYVGRSNHPGLPPVEKCLHCHNYIIAGHPQILKEHRYYDTRTPTPWKKANYLAEHVLFNHQRHIRKEVACQECHGAVETMDRIRGKYFYMQFCIECHRDRKANLGCWLACHS
ncbi:MAG: cytochrome c3 family protein [Desulfobacterales bacterium]